VSGRLARVLERGFNAGHRWQLHSLVGTVGSNPGVAANVLADLLAGTWLQENCNRHTCRWSGNEAP
jgi:hypothetical protein